MIMPVIVPFRAVYVVDIAIFGDGVLRIVLGVAFWELRFGHYVF
jgi:hypothetical protein